MELLLRRPEDFTDWVVDKATGGHGFCHVAVRFSNGEIFESRPKTGITLQQYRINVANWKVIPMKVNEDGERLIYSKALPLVGHKYDWWAIAKWVFWWVPFVKEHPVNYICSEAAIEICQPEFIAERVKAWQWSPNKCEDLFRKYELV